jgi:prepilin-type N-terminal cleavage/methylation domain-containing protein
MKSRIGFTLVELIVVVLIIAALAAIAIPRISSSSTKAKSSACDTNVDVINTQIELYKANTGSWPSALTDVTGNEDYFPDGEPNCPYGTAYSLGANHRVAPHNHSSE